MNKYGIENFFIELLEEYEEDLLEEMEIKFIQKYDSYKNGYNATLGGDGKRYFEYSDKEVIKKYQELKHLRKTAEYFNCDEKTLRKILRSNNITINYPKNIAIRGACKKIAKLDKDTSEILEIYPSIKEASKEFGGKYSHEGIGKACNGKQKTAYGFK